MLIPLCLDRLKVIYEMEFPENGSMKPPRGFNAFWEGFFRIQLAPNCMTAELECHGDIDNQKGGDGDG